MQPLSFGPVFCLWSSQSSSLYQHRFSPVPSPLKFRNIWWNTWHHHIMLGNLWVSQHICQKVGTVWLCLQTQDHQGCVTANMFGIYFLSRLVQASASEPDVSFLQHLEHWSPANKLVYSNHIDFFHVKAGFGSLDLILRTFAWPRTKKRAEERTRNSHNSSLLINSWLTEAGAGAPCAVSHLSYSTDSFFERSPVDQAQ